VSVRQPETLESPEWLETAAEPSRQVGLRRSSSSSSRSGSPTCARGTGAGPWRLIKWLLDPFAVAGVYLLLVSGLPQPPASISNPQQAAGVDCPPR